MSPTNLATDPRVYRQLELLCQTHKVTAAGHEDPRLPGVDFVRISPGQRSNVQRAVRLTRLVFRRFKAYHRELAFVRNVRAAVSEREFDLIVANDAESWPLGLELRGHGRVLLDAHEYAPREFEDVWWWRLLHQPYRVDLCRQAIPRADGMMTVCRGIADEYARCFGREPLVVMNAPPRRIAAPTRRDVDQIRIIHHGAAIPSRRIEVMLSILDGLDNRFRLDLMLTPNDPRYLALLAELVRSRPRARLRPPVPMQNISEEIRDYDVGLFLLQPTNFNYLHALPNKFFEFVQARLAVAIGPSPEMAHLVRKFDCGIVAADFRPESLALQLNALTSESINRYKENSHRAAEILCWEHERMTVEREVERLLSLGPCVA